MIKFKAWNARNSRAIAKFHNAENGHFGHNAFIHELIRGSLHQCGENDQRNEQISGVDLEDSEVYSPYYSSHSQERAMGDAEGAGYE